MLLVVLLIAKDASHLGDRFIMRGSIQAGCLLYGASWLLAHPGSGWMHRYLLIFSYIFVLFVSACLSEFFAFSAWQVLSLLSVVAFYVAVCESRRVANVSLTQLRATGIVYLIVCVLSIAGIWVMPDFVYQTHVAGGTRFSGVFGRPGTMGAAAGILLAIALFGNCRWRYLNRTFHVVAAVAALVCLALTGARTFWVAAAVASVAVSWFYLRNRFRVYCSLGALAGVAVLIAVVGEYRVSESSEKKILRTESIENLTGRTEVWALAMKRVERRPWLGYGFAAGGMGVATDSGAFTSRARASTTVPTLHSGYVQSLVDSGTIGTALYGLIVGIAILRMLVRDRRRSYGAECFALIFLAVANIGESVIFTASTFPSIFFWYAAILAFSLRRDGKDSRTFKQRVVPAATLAEP